MGECVGNRTRNRQDNEKLLHFTLHILRLS
ncbi:hypothetical protein GECvBGOT_gp180c [Salmonella phage GEC_vB_GOT]|nr:hypothetical protein GECvBGOT_gp180c [Salmonella phage GEC_vB_GOT]